MRKVNRNAVLYKREVIADTTVGSCCYRYKLKDAVMKFIILLLFFSFLATASTVDSLTVIHSNRIVYTGDSGEEAIVDHYLLSDSSLCFIKLFFSETPDYTLPQTVSGSGVRYSDEMDMTWWESGDSAMVQRRDSLGNWETTESFRIR